MHFHRRKFLQFGVAAGAAATVLGPRARRAAAADPALADRKLLFVVGALGGASILDSFLPIAAAEVGDVALADTLNVFPDAMIARPGGSELRCVKPLPDYDFLTNTYDQDLFLKRHGADVAVMTVEGTSVNHQVAQKRSVTGAGINGGMTIMEAAAMRHGDGLVLANANMSSGGYLERGEDPALPEWAAAEVISDPRMMALATHGHRGLPGLPGAAAILRARAAREDLEELSAFGRTFAASDVRAQYLASRRGSLAAMESADLVTKLMLQPTDTLPPGVGLTASPLLPNLVEQFPDYQVDPYEAQAALGFLLAYYGVSCAITLGLDASPAFRGDDVIGAPLAFDFSHTYHRLAQSLQWNRLLRVVDGLISLLKRFDYLGDPALGKMWDRSLVYIATDFGREKSRPAGAADWSSGHHLNNGHVLISPLIRGNRVYGGVDPKTGLTYGFDRTTGEPRPGTLMREGDVYSAVAHALDIDFPERRDVPALVR